jgi:hypothetical protein
MRNAAAVGASGSFDAVRENAFLGRFGSILGFTILLIFDLVWTIIALKYENTLIQHLPCLIAAGIPTNSSIETMLFLQGCP